jgi:hypothetical protein
VRRLLIVSAAAGSCLLSASACTGSPAQNVAPPEPVVSTTEAASPEPATAVPAPPDAGPTQSVTENFGGAGFTNPSVITNAWLPLRPGTDWAWEGQATVDGERIARRVELTITDLTKMIAGVRTAVAYELDYNDGQLIEAELVFFAQDDQGNVWHMGQYPEEYEEGVFVAAPGWIHGFQGASAGIFMKAAPQLGAPSYSQGWGPAVGWTDRAQVAAMGQSTCVRIGCYSNVLVISEFNVTEPDAQQLKFYAPGVGNVRVGWAGAGEQEQEELVLVSHAQLPAAEMATIRNAALSLERHAYELKHEVYKYTLPVEQVGA